MAKRKKRKKESDVVVIAGHNNPYGLNFEDVKAVRYASARDAIHATVDFSYLEGGVEYEVKEGQYLLRYIDGTADVVDEATFKVIFD